MTQTIHAIVEGDVLRPLETIAFADQQILKVTLESDEDSASAPLRSFAEVAREIAAAGCAKDLPEDLSTNPEHLEGFGKS